MITPLLVHGLFAATVFLEQQMDMLRFGHVDPLTGSVQTNFFQSDFDRDGNVDLLFSNTVWFQRDGMYTAGSAAKLPDAKAASWLDSFGSTLFVREYGALSVYSWTGADWELEINHAIDWPDLAAPDSKGESRSGARTLDRFLLDLEGDDIPEIALSSDSGVHVYRYRDGAYREDHYVPYRQTMLPVDPPSSRVWSDENRQAVFPDFRQDVSILWRGADLYLLERGKLRADAVYFNVRRFDFQANRDAKTPSAIEYRTGPLSGNARPMFLNQEGELVWTHFESRVSRASAFPNPISELVIEDRFGDSVRVTTSRSFRHGNALLDFDGDGALDIVRESSGIARGGIRESLNRAFFQRDLAHSVEIYLQNSNGQFADSPHMEKTFTITLDQVPYRQSDLYRRYRSGGLVHLTGDFNGDRHRDLVFQELPDRIVIYLQRLERFSKHAIHSLSVEPDERISVHDLDGNQLSDIALTREDDEGNVFVRVYFARRASR